MTRLLPAACGALLCISCSQHVPIPPGTPPIEAINPVEGTPMAFAWYEEKPLKMGVDTGAVQHAILFSPAVSELGKRIRGKGSMQSANVSISLTERGPHLTETTDVSVVKTAPYDGLLGWATISNFVWNLDIPKGHHQFCNTLPARVKRWDQLKLIPKSDYAQIKDPKGRTIIIDTGAPYALYIARKDWKAFKLDYPDAPVSVYSGYSPAAGGYYAYECSLITSYKIGDLELKNVVACESFADKDVMNTDKDIDIMLGIEAFYRREAWLDGPGNTLYFSSPRGSQYIRSPFNMAGATFIPDKNGNPPCKAFVAEWSPAWNSGLRTGDILISMNGRKFLDYNVLDYITMQEGAEATVTVQRKNQIITVEWTVPPRPAPGDYHPTPEAVAPEDYERLRAIHDFLDAINPASTDSNNPSSSPHESAPTLL